MPLKSNEQPNGKDLRSAIDLMQSNVPNNCEQYPCDRMQYKVEIDFLVY